MSMSELLRGAMKRREPAKVLDSTGDEPKLSGADDYTLRYIKLSTVAALHQWVETDDLDDGESMAGRLLALFVGIADANHDGDVTEDEQGVLEVALGAAWDYLVKAGVTEEDAGALLNDWDDDVADRVRDLVASVLPDGDDEAGAEIDNFVFSDDDNAPVLDAAYRKVMAVRGGKKVRINKRISGHAHLSPKQKVAIKKAGMKSHSAGAMMRRMKSMRVRHKAGL
ncbi:MAG: hypothetical protein LBS49_12790 [Candidatus Accumulibacter sp.]|jgi:hypothetical protein|nr:hypothetical protein [Accumulibacter sp.]